MKKILLWISTAVVLVLLTGCMTYRYERRTVETEPVPETSEVWHAGEEVVEGITMNLVDGSVSRSAVTLRFLNSTDREALFGEAFLLSKLGKDGYEELPVVVEGNYGFEDIGYGLPKGEEVQHEVDWVWLYGELTEGTYKLEKEIILRKDDNGIELIPYYVIFHLEK